MNNNRVKAFGNFISTRNTVRGLVLALATLVISGTVSAQVNNNAAQEATLKFRGGIGVIPVTGVAANGAANLNVVRGVTPGAPCRIEDLAADIAADGHIHVVGRGLLLASGNGIGSNAGQRVHVTLFCGAATSATAHSSTLAGVPLESDGDFRIDDFLSPIPQGTCTTPVLLVQNAGDVWFAAGIPKQ